MSVRMITLRVPKVWMALLVLALVGGGILYGRIARAKPPDAAARLVAAPEGPGVAGVVEFRSTRGGTLVAVDVSGLPPFMPGDPPTGPHGFHIHEGSSCEAGDPANPFQAAGGHWNPDGQPHGNHAGDFPVLFSNGGRAQTTFLTSRFTADAVVGRTVIIHRYPDDYRTQPAGDSGPRIACGIIVRYAR